MPTIEELFKNKESYKYGTDYSAVKSDTDTLVEQELNGLRKNSEVEKANPSIYGAETIRITTRTTSMLDSMKTDRGTQGLGGLIGGSIAKARQTVNNLSSKLLGFPAPTNPSNIIAIGKTSGAVIKNKFTPVPPFVFEVANTLNPAILTLKTKAAFTGTPYGPGNEQDTMFNLAIIKDNAGGSEIGKLLKSSLTGPPSEIGPKVVGGGITLLKDKARDLIFGQGDLKTNDVRRNINGYGSGNKQYSWIRGKVQDGTQRTDGPLTAKEYLDQNPELEKVSPLYGVQRKGTPFKVGGQFGNTQYGLNVYSDEKQSKYSPEADENYSHFTKVGDRKDEKELDKEGTFAGKTLDERGLGHLKYRPDGTVEPESRRAKNAFTITPSDDPQWDSEKSTLKLGGTEYKDLVPFHITRIGFKKNIFKAFITGLTETVSPSWSSNNFVGNPYKYYIYENIERSVTFTLNIASENAQELAKNWEKISHLTKAAYPLIPYQEDNRNISANITSPPFVKFTLGDMYKERFGIIDSLSYTVPDNGVWETDIDGFVLPKFIEASITIKFAEDVVSGNVDKLYDFKKDGEGMSSFIQNPIN